MTPLPSLQLQKQRCGLHTIEPVKVAHPADYRVVVETRSQWARVQAVRRFHVYFSADARVAGRRLLSARGSVRCGEPRV
jgi:hypothetical protein